jgi:hypothetical protein
MSLSANDAAAAAMFTALMAGAAAKVAEMPQQQPSPARAAQASSSGSSGAGGDLAARGAVWLKQRADHILQMRAQLEAERLAADAAAFEQQHFQPKINQVRV